MRKKIEIFINSQPLDTILKVYIWMLTYQEQLKISAKLL